MWFVVYDRFGNILRTGSCQKQMLGQQAGPGEFVMPGEADDLRHKVDLTGEIPRIVDLSPQEIADRMKALDPGGASSPSESDLLVRIDELSRRLAVLEAAHPHKGVQ